MTAIRGLTWDHPRGYNALAAAAERADFPISWDKQPLEGFESHPIADLCARYDLVVLDHPHVGEAMAANCLVPLEEVFSEGELDAVAGSSIGPSMTSYFYADRHWALPLDAATQVLAYRPDLLDESVPATWDAVAALSERTGRVAMSLASPHAILSFFSICAAFGEEPARIDPDELISDAVGREAYGLLSRLAARSPASVADRNPIGILDYMRHRDDVALCPLIYGYVNYTAPEAGHPVAFHDAPRIAPGERPGSTLGGTGIGICRRCDFTPELKAHLLWLMSEQAQSGFIPAHDGQPSRRDAWADHTVNAAWGNFYRNTAETLETAYVRPRFNGYIAFQSGASALLRESIAGGISGETAVAGLKALYTQKHRTGAPV